MKMIKVAQYLSLYLLLCLFITLYAKAFELPLYLEIHNADDIYQLLEDELITADDAEVLLDNGLYEIRSRPVLSHGFVVYKLQSGWI